MLVAFVTPFFELFDRWDAPGLDNDTETGVFCVVVLICLVLLVCKTIQVLTTSVSFTALDSAIWYAQDSGLNHVVSSRIFIPPQRLTPLKI